MKNSAAVPSGTAERRRGLTKLMPIIFARYLASLTVHVASSQSAPLTHSLPFIRLFSLPIYLAQLPLARFIMRSFVARRARECPAAPAMLAASLLQRMCAGGIRRRVSLFVHEK